MHTGYMKYIFVIVLILLFISSWLIITPANASRNCYIATQKELDVSAFQVQANPNAREVQCVSSFQIITSLGVCVDAAHNRIPVGLRSQISPIVTRLVSWIRYQTKDVSQLRVEHDVNCSAYVDTMFVPPDINQ